jgi:murein DD-endopeptidase MepM/ murein hydrolase activator NlpD
MKQIIIFIATIFIAHYLQGQNYQKVIISSVKTGDGLFDFFAENPNYYPIQLNLTFTEFSNMTSATKLPFVGTIQPGKHKIFNIRRIILDIPGGFKYIHSTRIGAFPVNYDPSTVYDLPVGIGKETKTINFDLSQSDDPNKILWGFSMSKGDTVFAAREGVVCMMTKSETINGYKSGENSITILHPDNSFGKYEALADSQVFVKMGDFVQKGAALGIGGGSNYAVGIHVRFSVYFVNARIDSIEINKIRNYHQYINPLFRTGDSDNSTLTENKMYLSR